MSLFLPTTQSTFPDRPGGRNFGHLVTCPAFSYRASLRDGFPSQQLLSFPASVHGLCDLQGIRRGKSILRTAEKRKWRLREEKALAQGWGWTLSPPESELALLLFLCLGSISFSHNNAHIPFGGIYSAPISLRYSGENVSNPSFRGAHVIQVQGNRCIFSPWFEDGHVTQIRPKFPLEGRQQEAPLSMETGSCKDGVSLHPPGTTVEILIMETAKRKLR